MKHFLSAFLALSLMGLTLCAQETDPFQSQCRTKALEAETQHQYSVESREGWFFLTAELKHLGLGQFWKTPNPNPAWLESILDLRDQLNTRGVSLLLVPVPAKASIYPEKLDLNSYPDRFHRDFIDLLTQKNVSVEDLSSAFQKNASVGELLYCKQDSHWSGIGCNLAAKQLAATIRSHSWLNAIPKQKFSTEEKEIEISGDLVQTLSVRPPSEKLHLRFVGTRQENAFQTVAPDRSSPILLLGDSHTLVFSAGSDLYAIGAGLPEQLAYELGFPMDVIGVRGSGATPSRVNLVRRIRKEPDYLAKKKLVIWCFSEREFTQSDWQKIRLP